MRERELPEEVPVLGDSADLPGDPAAPLQRDAGAAVTPSATGRSRDTTGRTGTEGREACCGGQCPPFRPGPLGGLLWPSQDPVDLLTQATARHPRRGGRDSPPPTATAAQRMLREPRQRIPE